MPRNYEDFDNEEQNWEIALSYENQDKYGNWFPIPWPNRKALRIPFGYKRREDDEFILDPVHEELDALEKAKEYLHKYSYATVAKWLTEISGRKISDVGLFLRVKRDCSYDERAKSARRWATRYRKALEAAEKIEQEIAGAGRKVPYDEEGNLYVHASQYRPIVSSAERKTPEDFDDGTPCETVVDAGKRRRGPRRPRSSRKQHLKLPKLESGVQTESGSSD